MTEPLEITPRERAEWARHFACDTPEKIRVVQPFAKYYECKGCSGSCGCSHFDRETPAPELQQAALL
jgi:hypothetical protein